MAGHRGRAFWVLAVLSGALVAGAEEKVRVVPRVELTGAYAYLWDDSLSQLDLTGSFNPGWLASGNFSLTRSLGIAGEVSGNYKSERVAGEDLDFSLLGLHGGFRYTDRADDVATPYAQLLVGATRSSASVLGVSASLTDFSIQPGVGVMFRLSQGMRLGLGGDYRLVFTEGQRTNQFRVHAGLVFPLGEIPAWDEGASLHPALITASVAPGGSPRDFPRAELTGAYAYLWDDSLGQLDLSGSFNPGWLASGNFSLTRSLGIVGEVSGNYKTERVAGEDLHFGLLGLHGGLRYTDRDDDVATPYAQILVGATRSSFSGLGESLSQTDFSIQPGVGVMFRVSESIRLGLGGDYRLIFTEGKKTNQFRIHAGLVFPLGRARRGGPAPEVTPPLPPPPPPPAVIPEPGPQLPPVREPEPAPRVVQPAPPPSPPPVRGSTAPEPLSRAQGLLRDGRIPEAAEAYREYLGAHAQGTFTIPVAVYCEVPNLARHVETAGDVRDLLALRLAVRGQRCWGLYWGLFPSRGEAQATLSRLPPALRTSGQAPTSVSWLLARPD